MRRGEPYLELVARNVRVARAAVTPKLSQNGVAERMRALGFKEWRRQTVGNTERGQRRLSLEETLGLMVALETDMTALVYPPGDDHPVATPGGYEVMLPAARHGYQPRPDVWDGNRLLIPTHPSRDQR
jgi:hypothetical protein